MKELIAIQTELKAPKSQFNSFGNFNYRNAEDILEGLKPLLLKYECRVVLSEQLIFNPITGQAYINAIATITNKEGLAEHSSAFAREALAQKGMNDAQLTGSTSSYARKYALGGLFLLDDTKDADTDEYHNQVNQPEKKQAEKKQPAQKQQSADPYVQRIESELGGRNLTAEAQNCKTLEELAQWYANLPKEYKKPNSPVIKVKDERKLELQSTKNSAEVLSLVTPVAPEPVIASGDQWETLKDKTLAHLKEVAKSKGVVGYAKMDKAHLITSIINKGK